MWGSVHQEVTFDATPKEVYEALMDSRQHAAYTGGAAKISRAVGGAFRCSDESITGRNVELVENERIVQAWRLSDWEDGVYSIVRFEIAKEKRGTKLVLDHTGIPESERSGIDSGWGEYYWEPMKRFFSGRR
jgi:activator of HSP90 ATPase